MEPDGFADTVLMATDEPASAWPRIQMRSTNRPCANPPLTTSGGGRASEAGHTGAGKQAAPLADYDMSHWSSGASSLKVAANICPAAEPADKSGGPSPRAAKTLSFDWADLQLFQHRGQISSAD